MKKVKLDTTKLQLIKHKIANLNNEELANINGGTMQGTRATSSAPTITTICPSWHCGPGPITIFPSLLPLFFTCDRAQTCWA